jgi:hypothetical protein
VAITKRKEQKKTENNILLRFCQTGPAHKQNGITLKKNFSLSLRTTQREGDRASEKRKNGKTTQRTTQIENEKNKCILGEIQSLKKIAQSFPLSLSLSPAIQNAPLFTYHDQNL